MSWNRSYLACQNWQEEAGLRPGYGGEDFGFHWNSVCWHCSSTPPTGDGGYCGTAGWQAAGRCQAQPSLLLHLQYLSVEKLLLPLLLWLEIKQAQINVTETWFQHVDYGRFTPQRKPLNTSALVQPPTPSLSTPSQPNSEITFHPASPKMSLHSITKALSFTLHQSLGKNVSLFDSLKTLVYSWALILVVPHGRRLSLSFKSLLNDYSQPSREKDTQSIQYFVLIISFYIFVNRVVLAQMAKGKGRGPAEWV